MHKCASCEREVEYVVSLYDQDSDIYNICLECLGKKIGKISNKEIEIFKVWALVMGHENLNKMLKGEMTIESFLDIVERHTRQRIKYWELRLEEVQKKVLEKGDAYNSLKDDTIDQIQQHNKKLDIILTLQGKNKRNIDDAIASI